MKNLSLFACYCYWKLLNQKSKNNGIEAEMDKIRAKIIFLLGSSLPIIVLYSVVEHTVFKIDPMNNFMVKIFAAVLISLFADRILLKDFQNKQKQFCGDHKNKVYDCLYYVYLALIIGVFIVAIFALPHA